MGRADILWTVNNLAREVTKWNVGWDTRLLKLIQYMNSTKNYAQKCWIGDKAEDIHVMVFNGRQFRR